MKPEQIIRSLDHVGEDLLARSEQTIRARKPQPWRAAALAASLLLVLGVGGFFGVKALLRGRSGGSIAAESGTAGQSEATVHMTDPVPTQTLPRFAVGDSLRYAEAGRDFGDPEIIGAETLPGRVELSEGDTLPAFRNLSQQSEDEQPSYLDRETLGALAQTVAGRLGLTVKEQRFQSGISVGRYDVAADSDYAPARLWVDCEEGWFYLWGSGKVFVFYESWLEPEGFEADPANWAGTVAGYAKQLFGLEENFLMGRVSNLDEGGQAGYVYYIEPLRKDPTQALLADCFGRVSLTLMPNGKLFGLVFETMPYETENPYSPQPVSNVYERLGEYPAITLAEAQELAIGAQYYTIQRGEKPAPRYHGTLTVEALEDWELVYLTDGLHKTLLPFYRFWVKYKQPADTDSWWDGFEQKYMALYVPAIRQDYLSDYPATISEYSPQPPLPEQVGPGRPESEKAKSLFGAWRGEGTDADGTAYVRELVLNEDYSFFFREGDPASEFSFWAEGSWYLDGAEEGTLVLGLNETDEDGNILYDNHYAGFMSGSWSLEDSKLQFTVQNWPSLESGEHADWSGEYVRLKQ